MGSRNHIAWPLFLAILLASAWPGTCEELADFLVVVHVDNPTTSLTRSEISKMFTKKILVWDDGHQILPVDQSQKSPVRAGFSKAIHGKPVASIRYYWQRMIFSGRQEPPVEKPSDQAVLEVVGSEPGAIGYVSGGVVLGDGVKVLGISDLPVDREEASVGRQGEIRLAEAQPPA